MPRRSTKTEVKEVSNEALEKIKLIEAVAIKEQEALIPIPKDSKTLLELIRLEIDKNDELEHEKRKRDLRIR